MIRSFDVKVGPKDKGFYDFDRDSHPRGCSFCKGMGFSSTERNTSRESVKTFDLPSGKYCVTMTYEKVDQDDHRLDIRAQEMRRVA